MPTHTYRPSEGHRLPHDPFNSIVAPRPIGWIGTLDGDGHRNLAPYSFFNALNYTPPLVGFSSNGFKHTVRNARDTGEFTWNLVSLAMVESMNATSTTQDVDEFEAAGLESVAGIEVAAPLVSGAPVNFECRVTQVIELQGTDGAGVGSWFTVGEVVAVHIDTDLLVDGLFDTAAADPALRAGGPSAYYRIRAEDRFDLRRPG